MFTSLDAPNAFAVVMPPDDLASAAAIAERKLPPEHVLAAG
jgi:hypothetical protein